MVNWIVMKLRWFDIFLVNKYKKFLKLILSKKLDLSVAKTKDLKGKKKYNQNKAKCFHLISIQNESPFFLWKKKMISWGTNTSIKKRLSPLELIIQ